MRAAALVTGAARGIGRSTVLALARAGYDVVVNFASSKTAAEQVAAGSRPHPGLRGRAGAEKPSPARTPGHGRE